MRGAIGSSAGLYDRGAADLRTTIRLNPNDLAAAYEISPKSSLSAEAIERGWQQVHAMLRDRPVMAQYADKAGWLHAWAARKFAGEDSQRPILWDASEPAGTWAQSDAPTRERQGRIRIRAVSRSDRRVEGSFDVAWSHLVFEFQNVANADQFNRLQAEATDGKLSKGQFVASSTETECKASEGTRHFYIRAFFPWAKRNSIRTCPAWWFIGTRSDQPAFIEKTSANWLKYARGYDHLILNALVDKPDEKTVARGLA